MRKIKELYIKYKEIINYLIFGALTMFVSFATYYIFARVLEIEEVVSSALSWICAVLFAYFTNKVFVFESKSHGKKEILKEMGKFFCARIISGITCDVGTFAIMVKMFHINDMISKLVTQIMVVILNYIFSKMLVFNKNKKNMKKI